MVICIVVSTNTACGVVLCDVAKMLTHAFTKGSLGVANVLFIAVIQLYSWSCVQGGFPRVQTSPMQQLSALGNTQIFTLLWWDVDQTMLCQ